MAKNKGKGLSGQALKDFRHQVAILKKKGLTSKRVDARSQKATRYMRSKIEKLSDVITGKMTAVKVSKAVLAKAKTENQRVYNGRILAPAGQPKMQAAVRRGEFLETVTKQRGLIQREMNLSKFFSMKDFMEVYDDHPHDLDKLRPKDYVWAFTYFGNRSRQTFASAEHMLGTLRFYIGVSGFDSMNFSDLTAGASTGADELWDGFSVISMENDGSWERTGNAIRKERRAADRKKWYKRLKRRNLEAFERFQDRQAEKQFKYRAKLSPEDKEIYREKARIRAKKSYDAGKAKNAGKTTNK